MFKDKTWIILGLVVALLAPAGAYGTLYTETFNSGSSVGAIPNGSPVGVTFRGTVNNIPPALTVGGLTVQLNISGGFNGSLYAYLVAPNGTLVVLMNQPGVTDDNPFGAYGSGMNITLQDGTSTHGSIQNEDSGSALSGTYNAAGTLANFNGSAADGTWSLYFSDLASGGGTSTLNSWSLNISAVPEPVNTALLAMGGVFALVNGCRWWLNHRALGNAPSLRTP